MTQEFAGFLKKLADTKALPLKVIAEFFGIKGKTFQRQYKNKLSEYHNWRQKPHTEDWIIYPENLSESLSLDEVAL